MDEDDSVREELRFWRAGIASASTTTTFHDMIIEIYLDCSALPDTHVLKLQDPKRPARQVEGFGKLAGNGFMMNTKKSILLEVWTLSLLPSHVSSSTSSLELATVYRKAIVFFRVLHAYARLLPAHQLFNNKSKSFVRVAYRFTTQNSNRHDEIPLSTALVDGQTSPIVSTHTFQTMEMPLGVFGLSVQYRTDCNLVEENLTTLGAMNIGTNSKRLPGMDMNEQFFTPTMAQDLRMRHLLAKSVEDYGASSLPYDSTGERRPTTSHAYTAPVAYSVPKDSHLGVPMTSSVRAVPILSARQRPVTYHQEFSTRQNASTTSFHTEDDEEEEEEENIMKHMFTPVSVDSADWPRPFTNKAEPSTPPPFAKLSSSHERASLPRRPSWSSRNPSGLLFETSPSLEPNKASPVSPSKHAGTLDLMGNAPSPVQIRSLLPAAASPKTGSPLLRTTSLHGGIPSAQDVIPPRNTLPSLSNSSMPRRLSSGLSGSPLVSHRHTISSSFTRRRSRTNSSASNEALHLPPVTGKDADDLDSFMQLLNAPVDALSTSSHIDMTDSAVLAATHELGHYIKHKDQYGKWADSIDIPSALKGSSSSSNTTSSAKEHYSIGPSPLKAHLEAPFAVSSPTPAFARRNVVNSNVPRVSGLTAALPRITPSPTSSYADPTQHATPDQDDDDVPAHTGGYSIW